MTDNTDLNAFRKRVPKNSPLSKFERRVRSLYASVANKLDIAAARGEASVRLPVDCYPRFIARFPASQVWDELNYRTGIDGLYWAKDGSGNKDFLVFSRRPLS